MNMDVCDKDLKVKYGMYNIRAEREIASSSFGYIVKDIKNLKDGYIKLGFHLHEFKEYKYYEDFGYETFESFCEANFALDKSEISRCMNVWWKFCDIDKNSHSRKMWIDEKYEAYNYSQLVEMLPLDNVMCDQVKPDMTVKEIRECKKQIKEQKKEQLETVDPVQETEENATSQLANNVIQMPIKVEQERKSVSLFEQIQAMNETQFASWLITQGKELSAKPYIQIISILKKEQKTEVELDVKEG